MRIYLLSLVALLCCASHVGATVPSIVNGYANNSCTSPASTCTMSFTVAHTGDTVAAFFSYCVNVGCTTQTGCTVTFSDGTNTWTGVSGASLSNIPWDGFFEYLATGYAANATASSYTLTATLGGSGCTTLYYGSLAAYDVQNSKTSSPLDPNATTTATGTSSTPSITSTGSLYGNALVLVYMQGDRTGTLSVSSPYVAVSVQPGFSDVKIASNSLFPGGSTTASFTNVGGSNNYFGAMIAIEGAVISGGICASVGPS